MCSRTVTCCIVLALFIPALATFVGGLAWPLDLLAAISKQIGFITAFFAVTMLVTHHWKLLVVTVIALIVHLVPWDSPRAERSHASTGIHAMRILQFNVGNLDRKPSSLLQSLLQHKADIAIVIEGGRPMLNALRQSHDLARAYPGTVYPARRDPRGWCLVLSRWPTRRIDEVPGQSFHHLPVSWTADLRVVEQPTRPFLLAVVHPPASRDPWSWHAGNQLVRRLVEKISAAKRVSNLPVVVAADLNATPTSWRSIHLCQGAGLRRCIPRWTWQGTYPARWWWPWRLPIDDLWVDPDMHVAGWRTIGGTGSDHRAVQVDLVQPDMSKPPPATAAEKW